MTCSYC